MGSVAETVRSLEDVTAEVLVSMVARSVMLIEAAEEREARQLPVTLPAGAASRHRLCTQIASRLKELGFEGDIGYNQLLYPSEVSTRALLTWLVDRLPRGEEEGGTAQEAMDAARALRHRMGASVAKWLGRNWRLPTNAASSSRRWMSWSLGCPDFETTPLVSRQVPAGADVLPSLLELATANAIAAARAEAAALEVDAPANEPFSKATRHRPLGSAGEVDFGWGHREAMPSLRDMLHSLEEATSEASASGAPLGRLAHAARFKHGDDGRPALAIASAPVEEKSAVADDTPESQSAVAKLTVELDRLSEEYQAERLRAAAAEADAIALERRANEAAEELRAAREANSAREHDYTIRRKTLEMLPDSTTAIAQLSGICDASRRRLADLEAEWERHRAPLAQQITDKRDEKARRRSRARAMIYEMKRCRAEMQQMVLDVADKDERAKVLDAEYSKMRPVNRALYTFRIMDIIGSIAKQKAEINQIIDDIRSIQKLSNKTSDTLRRTEAVADESVFSLVNAQKNDPAMVQSYRYLTDLRELFETLVDVISQTGAKDREARDYETKIKQLQSRVDANNLERILADLQQVRAENDGLLRQLKSNRPHG